MLFIVIDHPNFTLPYLPPISLYYPVNLHWMIDVCIYNSENRIFYTYTLGKYAIAEREEFIG